MTETRTKNQWKWPKMAKIGLPKKLPMLITSERFILQKKVLNMFCSASKSFHFIFYIFFGKSHSFGDIGLRSREIENLQKNPLNANNFWTARQIWLKFWSGRFLNIIYRFKK